MDYTLSTLLADIRRRGNIPDTAVTGTQDSDLLAYINNVLQLKLAGKIISAREGYFRQSYDYTLTATGVRYRIPARALGNKLSAVLLTDSAGNVLRKLNEIPYGRLREFYAINDTAGYTFEAGSIVLKPSRPSSTATTLRMLYYIRPNQVTSSLDAAAGKCFTVTNVNTTTGLVTLMASHGLTTGSSVDILKGNGTFEHVVIGATPTATASTTITVPDASLVEIGDFACVAGYSPQAQIPGEYYPLLAHLVAMEVLMGLGDKENLSAMAKMLPAMEKEAADLISPRNEEGSKKIMSGYGSLGSVDGPYRRSFWGV